MIESQCSRYVQLVSQFGRQALEAVEPTEGELSLAWGRKAAGRLLGATEVAGGWAADLRRVAERAQAEPGAMAKVASGHLRRGVYGPLLVHVFVRALGRDGAAMELGARRQAERDLAGLVRPMGEALGREAETAENVAERLWWACCVIGLSRAAEGAVEAEMVRQAEAAVERVAVRPATNPPGALHELPAGEALDFWTYRELAGLHALQDAATATGRGDWQGRVEAVAAYHQGHTQPDYTTYEPWAVHAFARRDETLLFVDQQLHDAATNLQIAGPGAAPVVAVLLADAVAGLAGSVERGA